MAGMVLQLVLRRRRLVWRCRRAAGVGTGVGVAGVGVAERRAAAAAASASGSVLRGGRRSWRLGRRAETGPPRWGEEGAGGCVSSSGASWGVCEGCATAARGAGAWMRLFGWGTAAVRDQVDMTRALCVCVCARRRMKPAR